MKVKAVPHVVSEFAASWIQKNPEYEYRFFDDQDIFQFFVDEFPEYVRAYRRIRHGAAKADLWRYLVIYKYGGVYVDMDCKCIAPLRQWVSPQAKWVTHLGPNRDVCQWLLISAPKNPIFQLAAEKSLQHLLCGRPQFIQFQGFKLESEQSLHICDDAPPVKTRHPIMTLTGPAVLQQSAEEIFKSGSNRDLFDLTQVVCVSVNKSCQMGGNVFHDYRNEDYLRTLTDQLTPHYEDNLVRFNKIRSLYKDIKVRLKRLYNRR